MSKNQFDISRRKILGAVGTIGGAAALGGTSTLAFFSDEEEFSNNQLVAGSLDLKVDWSEHYSDWSDDEDDLIDTVSMEPGNGLAGFPSAAPDAEKSVYVSDTSQFLANTAIEAFPDVVDTEDPEGIVAEDYDGQQVTIDDAICDFPADLDEVLSHPFRTGANVDGGVTLGGEPNPQTTEAGDPLVNIEDVKPGDFGEVTFSFHVCGNPAYVWLTGALRSASENGLTEPERKDPDEDGDPDSTNPEDVELLDAVRAAFWYDTGLDGVYGATIEDKDEGEGDNYRQSSEVLLPLMGTLGSVITALETNPFPLEPEPVAANSILEVSSSSTTSVSGDISGDLAEPPIVTTEDTRFTESGLPGAGGPRNYNCANYENLLGLESVVGSEVLNPDDAPIVAGNSYSGCTTITVDSVDDPDTGDIELSSADPVKVVSVKGGPNGENVYVFSEPVTLDGALFTTPGGSYGISNIDVCCPVDDNGNGGGGGGGGGGGEQENGRECFPNSTTAYIGFEWWLPVDHANEIQTDSVSFDLGFYTEQCRHNDGLGNVPN